MQITAKISRGPRKGETLVPYQNKAGQYIVSPTRFERDYLFASSIEEIIQHLKQGLKLRMAPTSGGAPSLISPKSIALNG